MDRNWLDIQHRGFSAYLEETAEDPSCERLNRTIARTVSTEENADTVLLDCIVKMNWIEQIEQTLPAIEDAIHQSRQFILRHGETVPVEKVKRVSKASVEHLSRHSELITTQPQPGEGLIPDKIFITENVGTYSVYENRFLYMLLCYLRDFVGLRYQKIVGLASAFSSELSLSKQLIEGNRKISYQLTYSESTNGAEDNSDSQAAVAIRRIKSILQTVDSLLRTDLMKEVSSAPLLKPPIARTNVLLHDTNFKAAFALYTFLTEYAEDGYERVERYRHSGAFNEEMRGDIAALISITSYLTYRCGGFREELDERLRSEQILRKEQADKELRDKLAVLKETLGPLSEPAFAYILAMEQRVAALDEMEGRLAEGTKLWTEAQAKLADAEAQIAALQAEATELNGQLRGKNEQIGILTRQNEEINQNADLRQRQAEEKLQAERQQFTAELDRQKKEFLCQYETLAEKYRLANARNRVYTQGGEQCCTKEAFAELEKEYEAFCRFYKQQWKLTKKQIRKETLWKK